MNMIKVLWWRFHQCFSTFTMLLIKESSQTRLFTRLSNHVCGVPNFGNTKALTVIFFSKYSKFKVDFKKAEKSWGKLSCFWDNCIWIGIVELSLLRTGYFSSAGILLTSNPKVLHVNKRLFPTQLNWQWSMNIINEYNQGTIMQTSTVLRYVYNVACRTVVWKRTC